jgi:thiol-disulfide isomerase/thioredoxin
MFAQVQNYAVGDTEDDFTITDTDGVEWNLYDLTAQGKYVYLDFFFDTCEPCQTTQPIYNEFHDTYGCNEFEIFVISINNGTDNDQEVIALENTFGSDFQNSPAVSSEGGSDVTDANFGITAYPTYGMVGPDKTLVENDIWPIADVSIYEATIPEESNETPMAYSLGLGDAVVLYLRCTLTQVMGLLYLDLPVAMDEAKVTIFKAFRFSENLADLFFLLLRHKFSSIAYVTVVNFNAEKRKKKEQKIRKSRCFEYIYNTVGSVVFAQSFNGQRATLETNLSAGAYLVQVTGEYMANTWMLKMQ